ncbi:MAG: MFS transporter, partial [Candidatus Nezhaarchaeota archaeon]|nr:MFS transporter [Candidatus Nezhaarchaeota archaeon]
MKVHYAWVIVLLGFLTVLGAHGFGRFAYSLVLTDMMQELRLDESQMGLIATFNFIGYLALATIGGALASRYGSRRVISLSALVMGVAMILTGLSKSFGEVALWRFVTGVGNGGAYLPAMALPSVWFAFRMRGRATGLVSAGIGAGFAIAGFLVPAVLSIHQELGWRYAWFYMGSALLAIFAIDLALVRNRPEDVGLAPLGAEGGGLSHSSSSAGSLAWGTVYR